MLAGMDPTPNTSSRRTRNFICDDDLWEVYGALCADEGLSRGSDIRMHVKRRVREWRRGHADRVVQR